MNLDDYTDAEHDRAAARIDADLRVMDENLAAAALTPDNAYDAELVARLRRMRLDGARTLAELDQANARMRDIREELQ